MMPQVCQWLLLYDSNLSFSLSFEDFGLIGKGAGSQIVRF